MVGLTVQKQLSEQSGMNGKKYLDSRAGTSGGGMRVWKGAALRIQPQNGEGVGIR